MEDNPGAILANLLTDRARYAGRWRDQRRISGAVILQPDMSDPPMCVLRSGLAKLYYPVANGDEWTKSYIVDSGVFGPAAPGETRLPFGACALERCEFGTVDPSWLADQVAADPELGQAVAVFQRWLIERKRQREEDLLCLSPEERFQSFLKREPALAQRLELREIARFLRVTPAALSRIRRRLRGHGRADSWKA